jgi:hypothetical protein
MKRSCCIFSHRNLKWKYSLGSKIVWRLIQWTADHVQMLTRRKNCLLLFVEILYLRLWRFLKSDCCVEVGWVASSSRWQHDAKCQKTEVVLVTVKNVWTDTWMLQLLSCIQLSHEDSCVNCTVCARASVLIAVKESSILLTEAILTALILQVIYINEAWVPSYYHIRNYLR